VWAPSFTRDDAASLLDGSLTLSLSPRKKESEEEKKTHNFETMTTATAIPTSSFSARAGDAATTNAAPAPPRDVSIAIVKASQREHVLSRLWPEFVKVKREKGF